MATIPKAVLAPDWAQIIEGLRASGYSNGDIGRATQSQLTNRMVSYYAAGVQPLHWRGEVMIALWLKATGATREQLPTQQIVAVKGRAGRQRRLRQPFEVISLPAWPPVATAPADPPKKRRGRPPKVRHE